MDKELQSKLVEILSQIQNATSYTVDQLPELAQQYILYGKISATFWFLFLGFILFISIKSILKCKKAIYNGTSEDIDGLKMIAYFAVGSISFIFLIPIINATILVWTSPKIWLLKEIATLLK